MWWRAVSHLSFSAAPLVRSDHVSTACASPFTLHSYRLSHNSERAIYLRYRSVYTLRQFKGISWRMYVHHTTLAMICCTGLWCVLCTVSSLHVASYNVLSSLNPHLFYINPHSNQSPLYSPPTPHPQSASIETLVMALHTAGYSLDCKHRLKVVNVLWKTR